MIIFLWFIAHIKISAGFQFNSTLDRLPIDKQLEYCHSISPNEYIDGLTDGNFIIPSFLGKTYYYRSYCFYQLALSSLNIDHCKNAISRMTLLGDGKIVSPEKCRKEVLEKIKKNELTHKQNTLYKKKIQDLIKLQNLEIKKIDDKNWLIEIMSSGKLFGDYQITIDNLNAHFKSHDKTIFLQNLNIETPTQKIKISINKDTLESCQGCKDKLITPIGIGLKLIKTKEDTDLEFPIYSNILNGYLN